MARVLCDRYPDYQEYHRYPCPLVFVLNLTLIRQQLTTDHSQLTTNNSALTIHNSRTASENAGAGKATRIVLSNCDIKIIFIPLILHEHIILLCPKIKTDSSWILKTRLRTCSRILRNSGKRLRKVRWI